MNKFLRIFLLILITLSSIFLAYNIQNKIKYLKNKKYSHSSFTKNNDYNKECPDTYLKNKKGQIFRLSHFKGNVILLRFTSFSKPDIPRLIFLDHLYEAYNSENFNVFFIHLKTKNSIIKSYNSLKLLSPIIQNDINISNLFKPKRNAIIIIDRN
ncbi:MAG: redoxin domain-containing protein, partial [Candidatus Aminicenantes bacterium]|nr:redoxin domain-containing protein [Candidatus Aminicenantes bacterium]